MTNETNQEKKTCSICFGQYDGFGNNAQPVNDGRCCDACNARTVITARINITLSKVRR